MKTLKIDYQLEIEVSDEVEAKIKKLHHDASAAINKLCAGKPEPKPEVFYHKGQIFGGPFGEYLLAAVEDSTVMMLNLGDGCYCGGSKTKVENTDKITETEFKQICHTSTFTLIEE